MATLIPNHPAVHQIRIMRTPLTNRPVTGPDARALSFAGEFEIPSDTQGGEENTIRDESFVDRCFSH